MRTKRDGQVLVIVIIAISILTCLIFFVYNLGDNANQRLDVQNAADAVAVSGAGWMARSMNVIAMNNVEQAKLIALVPVLDAVPLASQLAFEDANYKLSALADRIGSIRTASVDPNVAAKLLSGLAALQARTAQQADALQQVVAMGDFSSTTYWRVPGGGNSRGSLWDAAIACCEFSAATHASAGNLAADAAHLAGKGNDSAFLVPILPKLPAVDGTFLNFQPVLTGQEQVTDAGLTLIAGGGPGGAIPDAAYPHRLGPWARLFYNPSSGAFNHRGWRQPILRGGTPGTGGGGGSTFHGPSVAGIKSGGVANLNIGSAGGGTPPTGGTPPVLVGYRTFGPYPYYKSIIANSALQDTCFADANCYPRIADIKLQYMFAGVPNPPQVSVHRPMLITALDRAIGYGNDPAVQKTSTQYWCVEIAYQGTDDQGLVIADNSQTPILTQYPGWVPPENLPAVTGLANPPFTPSFVVLGNGLWKISVSMMYDNVPYFFVFYFVFADLDIGGSIDVQNPCNWDQNDIAANIRPKPILLDTSAGDYNPNDLDHDHGARRAQFTYLGVARKRHTAPLSPNRFGNANPIGLAAMAQAEVFNNASWDLWTQAWAAQLAPVTQWNDWIERLQSAEQDIPSVPSDVTAQEAEEIKTYMLNIGPDMAGAYLEH